MKKLDRFLEYIQVANISLGKNYLAYRMDRTGNNDMRKHAGLGTCSRCDYFMLNEKSVILIEETRLTDTMKNLKSQLKNLGDDDQNSLVKNQIEWENRLKIYGSMLVLCRLAALCRNFHDTLHGKSYKFWLVDSGSANPEELIFF